MVGWRVCKLAMRTGHWHVIRERYERVLERGVRCIGGWWREQGDTMATAVHLQSLSIIGTNAAERRKGKSYIH